MSVLSIKEEEEELQDKTVEQLRQEQVSVQRQLAALKDLEDARSVKAKSSLQKVAKDIRHQITLRKPVDERVGILEGALG
eukprot:5100568-Karenia_brevis.AAC.1